MTLHVDARGVINKATDIIFGVASVALIWCNRGLIDVRSSNRRCRRGSRWKVSAVSSFWIDSQHAERNDRGKEDQQLYKQYSKAPIMLSARLVVSELKKAF